MKQDAMLEAINDYFSTISADDIVTKLEELGCEFEDATFIKLPEYSHLIDSEVKIINVNCRSKVVPISGIARTDFCIKEFSQFDRAVDQYSSNDEMMLAA